MSLRAFGGSTLTDDGLQSIANLPNLGILEIKSVAVTDAGLLHLRKMTALRQVRLATPAVTDRGIADLQSALPHCRVGRWTAGGVSEETVEDE